MVCRELSMDYIKFGEGERAFIVLPGMSVHSVMGLEDALKVAFKEFAEKYTVYVFDRAREMPDDYSVRQMATDTAEAMKALGIENADIFGASQGGMMEQYIAIDNPKLVHKMVIGSCLACGVGDATKIVEEWISLAEEKNERGLLESFADNISSEQTSPELREAMIEASLGITDEEYRRFIIQAKASRTFDSTAELSKIKCPVLVIGTKGDKVVGEAGSEEIANALGCELYIYDETYGHAVYDEAPDYRHRCLAFFEKK